MTNFPQKVAPAERLSPWQLAGVLAAICALLVLVLLPWLQLGNGTQIPQFFLFLGRFHPLILHLPIGWILLAVLLEAQRLPVVRRWMPEASAPLKTLIIFLGASSAFVAVLLGWMLSYSGGYDANLLRLHFTAGLCTAIGADLALITRLLPFPRFEVIAYPALLLVTAGALTLAGHLGASITHGSDFLTEYAPDPVRKALGLPVKSDAKPASKVKMDDRVAYEDVIKPVLSTTCFSCHGPEKSKGGLRMDSYAALMKGGSGGPAIIPGDAAKSELLRRVHLPPDDDDHMPPSGRPALTDPQIALLTWWINSGAPEKKTVAEMKPPADILALIQGSDASAAEPAPEPAPGDAKTSEDISTSLTSGPLPPLPKGIPGFLNPIIPGGNDLEFTVGAHFADLDDQQLKKLAPVADHVLWLDLARSKVSDAGLEIVRKMPHLQKLKLEKTGVGDAALASIAQLESLQVLNLSETKVTDKGLSQLAALKNLKQICLFETAVTEAGEKKLQASLPHVEIIRELPPVIAPAKTAPAPAVAAAKPSATPLPGTETIWLDDALPPDAVQRADNAAWTFVGSDPAPFSGKKCWKLNDASGAHQVFFLKAKSLGATRKILYADVFLDPAHPPLEVMLQWHDTDDSWNHRAWWGKDNLLSRFGIATKMGDLPELGKWVRLEVPSDKVDLDNSPIDGLAFSLYNGAASFDKAGTVNTPTAQPPPTK